MSSDPQSPTQTPSPHRNPAKRRIAWTTTIVTLVIAAVGVFYTAFGNFDITLSQQTLQQKIDAKMPFTTKSNVVFSEVKLDLSGDKIGLAVAASTKKLNVQINGTGQTTGTIRYDGDGSFYFHPEELKVTSLTTGTGAAEGAVKPKVEAALEKWLKNSDRAKAAEATAEKWLQRGAEMALERIPVYRVKDDFKGTIIKASLTSVEVKNNAVVAHISLWRLTGVVIGYLALGALALALAIALMLNPEGLLLFGFLSIF